MQKAGENDMSMDAAPYRPDLEKLLHPISVERPAGDSLRYEGTYDRIRQARLEDDARLNQGIYQTELKKADWKTVQDLCLEALETRSKDLQLAVWLLEAWLHLYGFSGVREGLKLLHALCESFWETLYPEIEGNELERRVAPLEWLNEKVSIKLRLIPITWPQTGDLPPYTFADWEGACQLENLATKNPKILHSAEAEGKVTLAKFQSGVALSPKYFYLSLYQDLVGAVEAAAGLERFLDEKCGKKSPSLKKLKDCLGSVQRLVADILNAREDEDQAGPEEDQEMQFAVEEERESAQIWTGTPIRSRAEAYRRLAEAADYLLRTEPHSPTPYLVKRAVAWGGMTLYEVLREIIRNEGEMQELNRLLHLSDVKDREPGR